MSTSATDSVHPWFPATICDSRCVVAVLPNALGWLRPFWRIPAAALVLLQLPLLAFPFPGNVAVRRSYCHLLLRSLGIRITLAGNPIRNLPGMLVVGNHTSWADVLLIGAVLPGTFVARADLVDWPVIGLAARVMRVIRIDRGNLRELSGVVTEVTRRLRAGHTVVAFPEGTTFCGSDHGPFRPALFQSAIDAGRPVQPVRLTYRYDDGTPSTVAAFLGEDSLWASLKRVARTHRTEVEITVLGLQLPGACRRELAARCEAAVHATPAPSRAAISSGARRPPTRR